MSVVPPIAAHKADIGRGPSWATSDRGPPFASTRDCGSLAIELPAGQEVAVISLIIGILIIVVIGAILFWVIDKFCPDQQLGKLLKLLVVLVCLGAIVARLLPLLGYPSVL